MVTEVSPEHLKKAVWPMVVTELGIITEESPEQPLKAFSPIEVTEYVLSLYVIVSGIFTSPL